MHIGIRKSNAALQLLIACAKRSVLLLLLDVVNVLMPLSLLQCSKTTGHIYF